MITGGVARSHLMSMLICWLSPVSPPWHNVLPLTLLSVEEAGSNGGAGV